MRFLLQPLYLRTLFSISSSAPSCSIPISISHFSTSQTQPLHAHPFPRRHEELSRRVKVSVWWDLEDCPPADYDASKIPNTISAALRANGIMGPLEITAFGDALQFSRANQEALSSTGVNVSRVPNGGKNSADLTLIIYLMDWTTKNPPPAHILLISGDEGFSSTLHTLRMKNYNILLACDESKTSSFLCNAASIMWNWETLLKNEELTGKYCNEPPDDPYGSWYGHYKVCLEDPLLVEQPVWTKESSKDSDSKPMPVPKAVTDQIRKVLNSCPKGISIVDLRSKLTRLNVSFDKGFYGYKKFSSFLLSMPHILWLRSQHDGTSELLHSHDVNGVVTPRKVNDNLVKVNAEEPPGAVQQTLPIGKEIAVGSDYQVSESHAVSSSNVSTSDNKGIAEAGENHSGKSSGLFNRIASWCYFWRSSQESQSCEKHEQINTKSLKHEVFTQDSFWKDVENLIDSLEGSLLVTESGTREEMAENLGKRGSLALRSLPNSDLLQLVHLLISDKKWIEEHPSQTFPFKISSAVEKSPDLGHSPLDVNLQQKNEAAKKLLNIPRSGVSSTIVNEKSSDRSRHEILVDCRKLVKEILKKHPEGYHMGNFRNLFQERYGYPLDIKRLGYKKLSSLLLRIMPGVKILTPYMFPASTGLGMELLDTDSTWVELGAACELPYPSLQSKNEATKKLLNIPRSVVSSSIVNEKSSDRSRPDILVDCRKLVKEILKKHPEGYHMGNFRNLFQERYGYPLDIKRLGYKKLSSLLRRIMPGVKILTTYIFPASTGLGMELLDTDSTWDELGAACELPYPSLSDDKSSDSQRKISTSEPSQPQSAMRSDSPEE